MLLQNILTCREDSLSHFSSFLVNRELVTNKKKSRLVCVGRVRGKLKRETILKGKLMKNMIQRQSEKMFDMNK